MSDPSANEPLGSLPEEVDPPEAARLATEHELVIVDVREPEEWASGHAPSALHLPLSELGTEHHRLPRDRHLLVICRSGGRSAMAAAFLSRLGHRVSNVRGGMLAWLEHQLPVVTDEGEPGSVA
jgi:rhodanese-related sulfurtransferase